MTTLKVVGRHATFAASHGHGARLHFFVACDAKANKREVRRYGENLE
jgi:hypothetical protein